MSHDAVNDLLDLPQYSDVADPAYEPGLERIEALMDAMGRPHESIRTIHVGGTNGKGSVAAMIAAIATAAGHRTGLHTSPHLTHVTQRMRVNGEPASREWLNEAVTRYWPVFEEVQASFFEATVALTFLYFAEQAVDLAVIEVGLGGRLDATNVLRPALTIITNINLDHTDLLGDTHGSIAREKAGIVEPKTPILTGVTQDEARDVIAEVAAERNAPLHELEGEATVQSDRADLSGSVFTLETPEHKYERLRLSLPGCHQQRNAALAVRAVELSLFQDGADSADAAIRDGLGDVRGYTGFRGRLDVVQEEPDIVVDVGHNPSAISASLQTVAPVVAERGGTLHVCLNAVRGKRLNETARLLAERKAHVTPIPIHTERALPPDEIARRLRAQGVLVYPPEPLEDSISAFQETATPEDVLLIVGSHKLLEVLPDEFQNGQ